MQLLYVFMKANIVIIVIIIMFLHLISFNKFEGLERNYLMSIDKL